MFRDIELESSGINITKRREVLPTNVIPRHYDVTLEPDLQSFIFEGSVIIDLDVAEDSESISLNTLDLQIQSVKVTTGAHVISSSPDVSYDEQKQTTKILFNGILPKGSQAQLHMTFKGELNDQMAGFYRSTYKNADGVECVMATSQMEATDARRAFPCFDEPALKATFTITLISEEHLTCLSNMDIASESDLLSKMSGARKKAVTFNQSPKMSTYLVAFIVGELNHISTRDYRVPARVFAPPGYNIQHGNFSLDLAGRTLEFYEETFGIKYPLPKLDMVAIPDFSSGAMENWGLITFRTSDLLFDEKTAGANIKERVAEVVQHELAHQWFGNLVTMDFWDGLWLNEGFATWMSWYSCNKFYPEWKVWQTYVTDSLQDALAMDSLRSSHPIEVPIHRADQVNQIFDAIAYSKGSCVLRMISTYIGEDVFMEGIRRYLKKHSYGNTKTGDLWAALSDASGKDVAEIMNIWTKYVGHPVVTVTEDVASKSIHVQQNRLLRTADVAPEEDRTLYPVILGLRTDEGVKADLVLSKREDTFCLPDMDFFKLNADHTNIYRTSYSPARLEKLGKAAKDGLLSVEDRAGMIADAGALAACGYQQTSGFLNLLKGFDSELKFVVWDVVHTKLASVRNAWLFEEPVLKDGLRTFQRDLMSKKAHELGWEFKDGEDHRQQQFKALMFGSAGMAGDAKVIQAAQVMFAEFAKGNKSAIHPNLRSAVFGMALKYGGVNDYDTILQTYQDSNSIDERTTSLISLGRSEQPELIKRTLALALNAQEIKNQDMYLVISGLRTHAEGTEALFSWMMDNFDTLVQRFPRGSLMLGHIIPLCMSNFSRTSDVARIEKFFKERSTAGFEQGLAQSLDLIKAKSAWIRRDGEDVRRWCEYYGKHGMTLSFMK